MIVVIKLDLDRYDLQSIEKLVLNDIITMPEAQQSKAYLDLSEYQRLVWKRGLLAVMKDTAAA